MDFLLCDDDVGRDVLEPVIHVWYSGCCRHGKGYYGSPVCMENPNLISIPKETSSYSLVYTYE